MTYTSSASGCESGGGDCCFKRERMRSATADATSAASNWTIGDQVFIRIKRDAQVANTLASNFFMTGLRLSYPD
jgi:hypothetical protein